MFGGKANKSKKLGHRASLDLYRVITEYEPYFTNVHMSGVVSWVRKTWETGEMDRMALLHIIIGSVMKRTVRSCGRGSLAADSCHWQLETLLHRFMVTGQFVVR